MRGLGSDERWYDNNLKTIIPRLGSISDTRYHRYVRTLLGRTGVGPKVNEDVDAFFHDLVIHRIGGKLRERRKDGDIELTDYGTLEHEVNTSYMEASEDGLTRYGRESNQEHIILYLLGQKMLSYAIGPQIILTLTLDEIRKMGEGQTRYWRRWFAKRGITIQSSPFDKHDWIVFDWNRWIQSYKLAAEISDKEKREFIASVDLRSEKAKGVELRMKMMKNRTEIRRSGDWFTLLCKIYSIRYLEEQESREYLKGDTELRKVWGIPRKTWKDKWDLLTMVESL